MTSVVDSGLYSDEDEIEEVTDEYEDYIEYLVDFAESKYPNLSLKDPVARLDTEEILGDVVVFRFEVDVDPEYFGDDVYAWETAVAVENIKGTLVKDDSFDELSSIMSFERQLDVVREAILDEVMR